jgi:hypothetical protein
VSGGVYDTPQDQARLVHSLEHGAVEITYEASGKDALPKDVVGALKSAAQTNGRAIMEPTPQTLSAPLDGNDFKVSLAFAAWDRLIQCPGTITASQAGALARSFITAFVNADNAPEAGNPI